MKEVTVKRIRIALLLITILLAITINLCACHSEVKHEEFERAALKYMENRYGLEFEIVEALADMNFGIPYGYKMRTESLPDDTIWMQSANRDKPFNTEKFWDNYLYLKYKQEFKEYLEECVYAVFDKDDALVFYDVGPYAGMVDVDGDADFETVLKEGHPVVYGYVEFRYDYREGGDWYKEKAEQVIKPFAEVGALASLEFVGVDTLRYPIKYKRDLLHELYEREEKVRARGTIETFKDGEIKATWNDWASNEGGDKGSLDGAEAVTGGSIGAEVGGDYNGNPPVIVDFNPLPKAGETDRADKTDGDIEEAGDK